MLALWPCTLVVKKIKTFKTKPRIQKLRGESADQQQVAHRQQQQSQLYQQLAEHEGHYHWYAKTTTTTTESYTIYCLQK
jgi:hypothetical protein